MGAGGFHPRSRHQLGSRQTHAGHRRPQGGQVRPYAGNDLGVFARQFQGRCSLTALLRDLIGHAVSVPPVREWQIRRAAEVHDQSGPSVACKG